MDGVTKNHWKEKEWNERRWYPQEPGTLEKVEATLQNLQLLLVFRNPCRNIFTEPFTTSGTRLLWTFLAALEVIFLTAGAVCCRQDSMGNFSMILDLTHAELCGTFQQLHLENSALQKNLLGILVHFMWKLVRNPSKPYPEPSPFPLPGSFAELCNSLGLVLEPSKHLQNPPEPSLCWHSGLPSRPNTSRDPWERSAGEKAIQLRHVDASGTKIDSEGYTIYKNSSLVVNISNIEH